MAPRSRRQDAAELGHRIWDHLRGRAENLPGEFTPDICDDVTGWLWEGAVASLIREAIPGITDNDRLRGDNDRLRGDNDRLRGDNDRLRAEIEHIRALARDAGREIAGRASH